MPLLLLLLRLTLLVSQALAIHRPATYTMILLLLLLSMMFGFQEVVQHIGDIPAKKEMLEILAQIPVFPSVSVDSGV